MPHNPGYNSLLLNDLSLAVRIGYGEEERSRPQEVRVSIELRFEQTPAAMTTDVLQDTVCYGTLAEDLRAHCDSREFRLLERMAGEIYHLVRDRVAESVQIAVIVQKVAPPVKGLRGGAVVRCADFAP